MVLVADLQDGSRTVLMQDVGPSDFGGLGADLCQIGMMHRRDPKGSYEIRVTLWWCQNSYWKWPLIVDFPIKNSDFP